MQIHELVTALYQIGAIQFGDFILKSGKQASIYINLRKIISHPSLLEIIAEAMWQVAKGQHFDLVCGVPYTAMPIATCVSLKHKLPMIMRRKEKKDYGTKQSIEGEYHLGQTCLLLEDVITTGSSIMETATELEAAGLHITQVVALIDREQQGKTDLQQKYPVATVLSLSTILKTLLDSNVLDAHQQSLVTALLAVKHAS